MHTQTTATNTAARITQSTYEIKVEGELDESWSDWFNGLLLRHEHHTADTTITTLTGPVPDQAALRGILSSIWDLNLVLLSVQRLTPMLEE